MELEKKPNIRYSSRRPPLLLRWSVPRRVEKFGREVVVRRGRGTEGLDGREIGRRIAQARQAVNMTQRELGDFLSVTERSVASYEAGDIIPLRFMQKLEEILDVSAYWLLHGREEMQGSDEIIKKLDEILVLLKKRK